MPGDGNEYRQRIHPESPADLNLVVRGRPRHRLLRVGGVKDAEFAEFARTGGILVDVSGEESPCLEVVLVEERFSELFDVLIDDVASAAAGASSADRVSVVVADRIRKWQAFLKAARDGLSRLEQRGLYGELYVMLELGRELGGTALTHWEGPTGTYQDFAFAGKAVEVKTTAQEKPISIEISSERQLDSTNVNSLFLWVLALDVRSDFGETLPEIVERARAFAAEHGTGVQLEDLLLEAGYHDLHARLYTNGYRLRSSSIFSVEQGFPCIAESACPPGVGDVRYRIQLGALEPFVVSEEDVVISLRNPVA